jgi:hypothetical protein
LFALAARAEENCTSTNYKNHFFTWCLNDEACQSNLRLFSDDFWSFSNLLDDELLPRMQMTGADMCTGEQFWEAYLRSVDICRPNFYRDSNNECVLRAGKVEDEGVNHSIGFRGLLQPIMLVALIILGCWLAVKELEKWDEVLAKSLSIKKM